MFVDIHNHILPGVDDGAPDMEYALDMARLAVSDGTDTMVCTPHRAWMLRRDAPPDWILLQVDALRQAIKAAGIALNVMPGVEIPIGRKVANDLAAGRVLTIGAGRWALVELPFPSIPRDALDNLKAIADSGFHVVLAHPERNSVIQKNLAIVEACADLGIALQLTSGSVIGRFGQRAQATAFAILRHAPDWQIVIASDTHDNENRPPNLLSAARDTAALIVGEQAAADMVDARPRAMIACGPD
jgi:protein-tyrosine phosphatase